MRILPRHYISGTSIISGGTLVLGDKQRLTPSLQNAATLVSRWNQNREISIYNDFLRCSKDPQQWNGFKSTRCYQKYHENLWLTPQNQGKSSRCAKTRSAMLSRVTAATLVRWPPVNTGVLRIGLPWTNFSEVSIETQIVSFKKMHLKMPLVALWTFWWVSARKT